MFACFVSALYAISSIWLVYFTFWPFKYCETLGQKKVDVVANLLEEKEKNQLARNFEAETLTTDDQEDNQESQRTPALLQDEELD